jgi:hypothetical protein
MRNLDLNSLTSLYENKVVLKNVVNEAMPPYGVGEGGMETAGSASSSPDVHRAAMSNQPSYEGQQRLNEEQMKRAILIIAQEIINFLKTLPESKFVGGSTAKEEDTAFRAKVAEMIVNKLKMKSGEPIYKKAFAVHVARQLVDALIGSKTLSYAKPAGSGKSGGAGEASSDAPDL